MLLSILCLFGLGSCFGQTPQISGDLMLCPWTNGTATVTNPIYDSYQWYYKFWFLTDDFVAIDGATQASFSYDWYTYDQSLFKVVATRNGQTFESNTIQIDSYSWVGLTIIDILNENVTFDPNTGGYLLCQGGSFSVTLGMPYDTNIQWYKDGAPINGANNVQYTINSPGTYHVVAAPSVCPNNTSSNESLPIVVQQNPDCNLGVDNHPIAKNSSIKIYPNPVSDILKIEIDNDLIISSYSIIDKLGKVLVKTDASINQNQKQIDISNLSNGFYFLKLKSGNQEIIKKFIKK